MVKTIDFLCCILFNDYSQEAKTGEIDLPNDEPFIVKLMLDFLYTSDYSDVWTTTTLEWHSDSEGLRSSQTQDQTETKDPNEIVVSIEEIAYSLLTANAKVYVIADVYNLPSLKELAVKKYQTAIQTEWTTSSFVDNINYLWENTMKSDSSLKKIILKFVKEHITELLDRGEFVNLIKTNGEVAIDIVRYNSNTPLPASNYKAYYCSACKRTTTAKGRCSVCCGLLKTRGEKPSLYLFIEG